MSHVCDPPSTEFWIMKPEPRKRKEHRELTLPRSLIPFVWTVIVLVIQILLPWVVSRLGPRLGWSQRSPAVWNVAGLIAVITGLAGYAWCLAFHFRSYRTSVRVGFSPPHLVTGGPYRISRNPMYASGLFVWLGWTFFYGSPAVFVALLLLWSVFAFRVIPQEERRLEELFGEEYLKYKRSVGRWLGRS
jgi:protein-S-isoprenylcysteine O-methyltransferase Ste14